MSYMSTINERYQEHRRHGGEELSRDEILEIFSYNLTNQQNDKTN